MKAPIRKPAAEYTCEVVVRQQALAGACSCKRRLAPGSPTSLVQIASRQSTELSLIEELLHPPRRLEGPKTAACSGVRLQSLAPWNCSSTMTRAAGPFTATTEMPSPGCLKPALEFLSQVRSHEVRLKRGGEATKLGRHTQGQPRVLCHCERCSLKTPY